MAHASAPHRRPVRLVPALLPFLLAATAWLLIPTTASAEPPSRLPQPITDAAGVLDGQDTARIQQAADALYDEHQLQLWVTYVSTFDGRPYDSWAEAAARASNFGPDTALLAVATDDREFALWTPSGSEISSSDRDRISSNDIVPALRTSDWAGAAVAAAEGLDSALTPSSAPGTTLLVGGGVIAAGAGGVYLYSRRSKRKRAEEGAARAAQLDPSDVDSLATLPLESLEVHAQKVLVETDNAVRSSSEALELARGEFGDGAVLPFDRAYRQAQAALAAAFEIRQRLDDDIPETPQQQRDMLVQLISSCGQADRELDAQVEAFDKMRDLLLDAPARLDALTQRAITMRARLPEAEATLSQLRSEFPAEALAPVADNVRLAREEIEFAEKCADEGRAAVARPVGQQGDAVRAIREAEGALGHAGTLLDAVDHAEEDIRRAIATLPEAMEDAAQGIADAERLAAAGAAGGAELAEARRAAQEALDHARAEMDTDPLGSFTRIVETDARLDALRAQTRQAHEEAQRTRQRLEQDLTAAQSQVTAASDFIGTRRGVVGAEARTRLSEAQRHLQAAQQLAANEPGQALQHAHAAASLAAKALRAAQKDVDRWERQQYPPRGGSSGGNIAGAVLGGILINSVLSGGGGFGGGGFGGGGFGGGGGGFGGSSGGRF